MDAIVGFVESLTVWHWLGLAIVLLALEVAVGTFDLLWIAMGAFTAALFTLIGGSLGWEAQLAVFAIAAMIYVALGRTVFKGLRERLTSHPKLNDRMSQMVGSPGRAMSAFQGGQGQVKVGDTVWPAKAAAGEAIAEGAEVVVAGAEGTMLTVKPA